MKNPTKFVSRPIQLQLHLTMLQVTINLLQVLILLLPMLLHQLMLPPLSLTLLQQLQLPNRTPLPLIVDLLTLHTEMPKKNKKVKRMNK